MRSRWIPVAAIVHWIGLALVAALAGALLLAPPAEAARKITIRFATIIPPTFPYYDGMLKFKEILEKKLPGRVEVKLYHSGKLGDEREIEEGVLQGSVHVAIGAGAFAGFAPIMDLVELPFLIKNQAHLERIATGPIGRKLAELVAKQSGFRVLAWYSTGDSSIETTRRPVRKPEDLRGAKIRTMPNKAMVAALKALGANPTPVPYLEVYTSLKQGVVEGTTNDWMSVKTMKFYESLKYATDPSNAYLAERRGQMAGSLSGGEQQMLALGRGLMARPRLLLVDEPFLGLAPEVVQTIAGVLQAINREGTSVLFIEQNVELAFSLSQRGYVMESGRMVLEGKGEELLQNEELRKVYLGL
ncbi:MAG: TRAP transporter substrate-binding protein DctP [Nitrospinota bacterium]